MSRVVLVLAVLTLALMSSAAPARPKVISVKPKATLWGIAKRHGITVKALRAFNDMSKKDVLKAGQKLRIPARKAKSVRKTTARKQAKRTAATAPDWVWQKPPQWTQTQKTKAERGGINPCNTPNPGWKGYTKWNRAPSMGQMVLPRNKKLLAGGDFDVIFHFHGHEPIRKEWVQVMDRTVLVAVTLGVSSSPYVSAFSAPNRFEQLVKSVEHEVARYIGKKKAHARHIGLSSWSAGYGALLRILDQPYGKKRVDSVVVLDGMHSSYRNGRASVTQLAPFIAFAKRAIAGDKHMFISHSSIIPPGYASSTETAQLLLYQVGGRPRKARPRRGDPMGLELISRYSNGNLHVRGFAGNDKMDHCAHIGLFRDILSVHIKKRWASRRAP
jgi:LysM repeat protein